VPHVLQSLLGVVEQLLQQQTPSHVRAALSILGHVRFSSRHTPKASHEPHAPDAASKLRGAQETDQGLQEKVRREGVAAK